MLRFFDAKVSLRTRRSRLSLILISFSHVSRILVILYSCTLVKELNADVEKICKHLRRVRFLFRNEAYEFLRCEGCGQIVRLPL